MCCSKKFCRQLCFVVKLCEGKKLPCAQIKIKHFLCSKTSSKLIVGSFPVTLFFKHTEDA